MTERRPKKPPTLEHELEKTPVVAKKELKIYPWNMSITGAWSLDTGILLLRDLSPEELSSLLWEYGIRVQNTAIVELIAHGNPRKASAFARKLVADHPEAIASIQESFGEEILEMLLHRPLEKIPGSPEEFNTQVFEVVYIQ